MTDEERAILAIEEDLDAALGHVSAPPALRAAVLRRVRKPARLPEILDAVGPAAVLAVVLALLLTFAPPFEPGPLWMFGAVIAALAVAFAVAIRSLREA